MNLEFSPPIKKRMQYLLMKAVDNEISQDERREFYQFLILSNDCKIKYQQFKRLKIQIQNLVFERPACTHDEYWETIRQRL